MNNIGEEFIASDGNRYVVTAEGTVKKVSSILGFVSNDDISALEESVAKDNTAILHKFLSNVLTGVVYEKKRGWVKYKGFSIKYSSHGYLIKDSMNFSEKVNVNDYHNDFPTPESVLTWLRENSEKPVIRQSKEIIAVEAHKEELLSALSSKYKVKEDKRLQKGVTDKVIEVVKEIPRPQALAEKRKEMEEKGHKLYQAKIQQQVDLLFSMLRKKVPLKQKDYLVVINKISRRVNLRREGKKIVSLYTKGKITGHQAIKDFKPIIEASQEIKDKKPKRVPRFRGIPELYYPVKPKFIQTRASVLSGKDSIEFQQEGPSGDFYKVKMTATEYMVNVLLHTVPKAMECVMGIAEGRFQVTDSWLNSLDLDKFIRDITVEFDMQKVVSSVNQIELQEFCTFVFERWSIYTAYDYVYEHRFKKGDRLEVYYPEQKMWYQGNVTSLSPLKMVFDVDGSIEEILSISKIRKLS
jgi:hypothetical protein